MKTVLISAGLLLAALLLSRLVFPIAILYAIVYTYNQAKWQGVQIYLQHILFFGALCIDFLANIVCAPLFNQIMIQPKGYKFGEGTTKQPQTLSGVFGQNMYIGTNRSSGRFISTFLNDLELGHVQLAADLPAPTAFLPNRMLRLIIYSSILIVLTVIWFYLDKQIDQLPAFFQSILRLI